MIGTLRFVSLHRIELRSPLTPEECVARLYAAADVQRPALVSLQAPFGFKPVIGSVTEDSVRLRKRVPYRNSFQYYLFADMRPENGGTVISGRFAMHPVSWWVMVGFFGLITLIGGMETWRTILRFAHSESITASNLVGAIMPLVMLAIGVFLMLQGRRVTRDEARFITDFLTEVLEGKAAVTK